jgi:hypothetical protein
VAEGDKRRHGYSRDKRPDCPQVVIALVVTPDGLPLAYEVLPGNTADCTTLRMFLARIEQQYGRARRVWVMDRGIPTEAVLAEMRGSDPPVQYLARRGASRVWRSGCWPSPGSRHARVSPSNCCPRTVNSTCSPRVSIASARNARCANGN